jgi:hypothetical protein
MLCGLSQEIQPQISVMHKKNPVGGLLEGTIVLNPPTKPVSSNTNIDSFNYSPQKQEQKE